MTKPEIFRPISNVLLGTFVILMAILLIIQVSLAGNYRDTVSGLCLAATAAAASWLLFLRPRLVFGENALEIVNPFRTITLAYGEINDLNTRYNLTIQVGARRFAVWVAPAPTRYSSRGIGKQDVRGLGIDAAGSIRAADSPRSASGVAAYLLRTRIEAADGKSTSNSGEASVAFNYWGAAAVLIPVSAFLLAQLLIH